MTLAMQVPYWAVALLVALFLLISVVLILTILIQRPMGGGLSGAFGAGAGSGQTAFGAKTGDALTIATIIIFVVWLGFAVGLNYAARPPEAPAEPEVLEAVDDQGAESSTGAGDADAVEDSGEGESGAGDAGDPGEQDPGPPSEAPETGDTDAAGGDAGGDSPPASEPQAPATPEADPGAGEGDSGDQSPDGGG